ncbi:hypothetical protein vBVpaS1601_60 [Vibrio phage vB_VpaS_1601]|uniref:hypothetical protein n=1 Tax=Vibrio phage SHOU24 TaxID=1414739 RepID=UPI0003ED2325|nr:hypothetical protein SHOU24_21 [Vibrio phage SHOU24]AHI61218.1 hypothetical protein SHOU24_21 [Vibrio phage SHOU24]WHM52753.1 hypothetical protein vBVpaP1601_60 [Vibrio phage vB_VpaP_1601]
MNVTNLLISLLVLTGCTINLQIDTDYASQNASDGAISETVQAEATTTPTVDVTADIQGEGL